MNNYIEEWKFLCVRIEELESLLNNFLSIEKAFVKNKASEKAESNLNFFKKIISPAFSKIFNDVKEWQKKYEPLLPSEVNEVAENYFEKDKYYVKHDRSLDWNECVVKLGQIQSVGCGTVDQIPVACQAVLSIIAIKAQFNSHLKNSDLKIRSITDLAFEHLRRTIVVNEDVKKQWTSKKETDYEKMGAIHLLSHGIWAFKVHGERGRTDLVYNEPIENYINIINRSAHGLVLTEWKKVSTGTLKNKAEKARKQLKKYTNSGVLGGIELKNTRYIVLVTEKTKEELIDYYEDNICYRHIIIETNPENPSKN